MITSSFSFTLILLVSFFSLFSSTEDSGTKKISKLDNSLQNVLDDDREKELNKDMVIDGADAAGEAEEDELDDETERERERFFKKEQQAYDDNELKVDLKKLEKEEQLKNMEVESESEEDPLQGMLFFTHDFRNLFFFLFFYDDILLDF